MTNIKSIKILLIEDNVVSIAHTKKMLKIAEDEKFKVKLQTACCLSEGMEYLAKNEVNIILLDLGLPDSHQLQTFKTVHSRARTLPIVIMTVLSDVGIATEAVYKGAQDYLVKDHVTSDLLKRSILYAIERKRVEIALRKTQKQLVLKEKFALLGQLAGGVGHELRNSLAAIKNAAFFLYMTLEKSKPDVKESLEILSKEVMMSEKIIKNLLDFAHPKPPTRRKISLNSIIMKQLSQIESAGNIGFDSRYDDSLPPIMADPDQLDQIFENIFLNACQAMPRGGKLFVSSEVLNSKWVKISISDIGVGIPKKNFDRVSEPLFTTKARGIILGLAVAKTLAEGHGGKIEVSRTPGKGSTFSVKLPISRK